MIDEIKSEPAYSGKSVLISWGHKVLGEMAHYNCPPFISRASTMNLKRDDNVCNYPLYLIGRFPIEKSNDSYSQFSPGKT